MPTTKSILEGFNQAQRDQIQGLLDLILGTAGKTGSKLQTLEEARAQAIADTKGLTSAAIRDFQTSIIPQIQGGAEGAGGSASALVALLSQKAAIDAAGIVAKNQGNQILRQETIAQGALTTRNSDLLKLIAGVINTSIGQVGSGGSSTFTDLTTPPTTLTPKNPSRVKGFIGARSPSSFIRGGVA